MLTQDQIHGEHTIFLDAECLRLHDSPSADPIYKRHAHHRAAHIHSCRPHRDEESHAIAPHPGERQYGGCVVHDCIDATQLLPDLKPNTYTENSTDCF